MATIRSSPSQVEIARWALRSLKDLGTPDADMPQLAGCAILLSPRNEVNQQFVDCVASEMWMPRQSDEICVDQSKRAIVRRTDAEGLLRLIQRGLAETESNTGSAR